MSDLFVYPDDRYLRYKWDVQFSTFRIVARDYRAVLTGDRVQERHRLILIQTASDLLDTDANLTRLGEPSLTFGLAEADRRLWAAADAWVTELRSWRIPPADMSVADIEVALRRRKTLEEQFNDVILGVAGGVDPAVTPPPVVIARAG